MGKYDNVDTDTIYFIDALKTNNIKEVKNIKKTDLHNHSALGTKKDKIERLGIIIPTFKKVNSISEMNAFCKKYISELTRDEEKYKFLIENTILSAIEDGIAILETSIDFRFFKFFNYKSNDGIEFLLKLKDRYKKNIKINYDIGLSRKNYNTTYDYLIQDMINSGIFYGIDLYGDEKYNDLEKFKNIYDYAYKNKLNLKAHVGEYSSADEIYNTIKYLRLNTIQHGINIVQSKSVMEYAKENDIIFNACISSNLLLNRVQDISKHPIRKMYDFGLRVTLNTDDLLLFDKTVSEEFLILYNNKIFSAEELNKIRKNGFK